MQTVIVTKAAARDVLKLKLRLILSCDSMHKISYNYRSLHMLGAIDCFHSFCLIVCLLTSKEDE